MQTGAMQRVVCKKKKMLKNFISLSLSRTVFRFDFVLIKRFACVLCCPVELQQRREERKKKILE
jgi:hypothetical protein